MSRSTIKDMTVGSPMKLVLGFAVPLLFGFMFQQLYSIVDTAIVGKVLGATKLGAVGSTGALNFLILGFCNGLCAGMSVPIAQAFGAKEYTEMRRFVANAAYIGAVISVIMGVLTGILCPWMLELMQTDPNLIVDAQAYIQVIFFAIPVTVLYNMASGILRALGDSKTPVKFIAIASVVNIALDLVFMMWFHMGVRGAAIATVISQVVSGVGCVVVIVRKFPILHLSEDDRKYRPAHAKRLIGMGIPMGLQFSITAIGSVIMQRSVNVIGVDEVSAMAAGGKISMFFTCIFDALSTTMATFAGQNIGARKVDRVNEGLEAASVIGCVYCVVAYIIMVTLGDKLLMLFLNAEKEAKIIEMAHFYLKVVGAFYIPLLFVNIVRLSIQGMGFTRIAMLAGVFELVARSIMGMVIVPATGYVGACYGHPAAWVAADIFLFPCYVMVIRKMRLRLGTGEAETAQA